MSINIANTEVQTDQPNLIRRILSSITSAFEAPNLHLSRRAQIEALEAKSDEELAALGIRRDQIAYHVFHDLFYA